jgi:hypothetical protein
MTFECEKLDQVAQYKRFHFLFRLHLDEVIFINLFCLSCKIKLYIKKRESLKNCTFSRAFKAR